ncbi:helix-turn-helix domain-containing protein [Mesorhizobium sp. M8A.F.Ca.ET.165.01.1.1]|uniref:helix-turn-helix domain-containing protein n=1 Tax=Mesorhizobium sp. M8A.F.Ca.ET.165.01.1.1 TaxID=2563960 RepID=UPI001093AB8C|nr:helix-turn-helix domain-containing protein [Mesorhizobium sp. M8A.F.Ca.ET.165.01.1.1]TGT42627.1 DNA-binding protein [Mesorhizobium sp. M8A.F.Ca.ET.165.01.1.1]
MSILDDYLDRPSLAAELKVSERTLIRWQNQPDGIPYVELGGRILYRVSSIRAWIEGKECRPNPRKARAA